MYRWIIDWSTGENLGYLISLIIMQNYAPNNPSTGPFICLFTHLLAQSYRIFFLLFTNLNSSKAISELIQTLPTIQTFSLKDAWQSAYLGARDYLSYRRTNSVITG